MTVEELKNLQSPLWIWEITEDLKKIFRKKIHPYKHVIWSQIFILALFFSTFEKHIVRSSFLIFHFYFNQALTSIKAEKGGKSPPHFRCHHSLVRLILWVRIVTIPSLNAFVPSYQQSIWISVYNSMCLLQSLLILTAHFIFSYKSGYKETVALL